MNDANAPTRDSDTGAPLPEQDPADRNRGHYGQGALAGLAAARVLVVGAGAVGNEVVKHLAMVGVGAIVLVDPDVVTPSNLNRCVLFTPAQAAARAPKATALAESVGKLATATHVEPHAVELEALDSDRWAYDDAIDLAICGVDDDHARYHLTKELLGAALADGRSRFVVEGAMGSDFTQMRIHELPGSACLVCNWTDEYLAGVLERRRAQTCLDFVAATQAAFPAISTQTSLVGAQMAAEAIKILAGLARYRETGAWPIVRGESNAPLIGHLVRTETTRHITHVASMLPNPTCVEPFCRMGRG